MLKNMVVLQKQPAVPLSMINPKLELTGPKAIIPRLLI
jgi:hypothetical protein